MDFSDSDILALEASVAAYSSREDVVKVLRDRSCEAVTVPSDSILRDSRVVSAETFSHDKTGADCLTMLCKVKRVRKMVVAFRGTELSIKEGDLYADTCWGFSELGNESNVKVMKGFQSQYNGLRQKLRQYLESIVYDELLVTGHSLGGALATLSVVDLTTKSLKRMVPISAITFAAPRVGNDHFKNHIEVLAIQLKRFALDYDPIPKIPFEFLGYKHAGKLVQIKKAVDDTGPASWLPHGCYHYQKAMKSFKSSK